MKKKKKNNVTQLKPDNGNPVDKPAEEPKEPIPGLPGENIVEKPTKEWNMTEEGFKLAQVFRAKQAELIGAQKALAFLRHDYSIQEKKLIQQWDMAQAQMDDIVKKIKESHKIIGDLVMFDYKNRKIIVQ